MRKLVVALVLIFLCCAACEDTPPLTVQAYAEQCAAIWSDQRDPAAFVTWGEWHTWVENQIGAFHRLNPPAELADYHDVYIESLVALRTIIPGSRPNGLSDQPFMMAGLIKIRHAWHVLLRDDYNALPYETKRILEDIGCVDGSY